MESEHILSQPARVLRQEQREHYFEHGYLFIEGIVGNDWLERLRAATYRHLEASREVTISNEWYDLAPVHTKAVPCIRRLLDPEREECFWAFANDVIADVAADLLGSDVLFHHGKLNFKWPGAGETNAIAWHQDLAFYPLTNYKSAAIGCYLEDTTLDHGPLQVVKGSHEAEIFTHYDDNDEWTGQLNAEDESAIDSSKVVSMPGPAGFIDHGPQRENTPRLPAESGHQHAAVAGERLHRGRCVPVYARRQGPPLRRGGSRQTSRVVGARPTALPDTARLVRWLPESLRPAARRGSGGVLNQSAKWPGRKLGRMSLDGRTRL